MDSHNRQKESTASHRQLIQHALPKHASKSAEPESGVHYADAAVNTDLTCGDVEALERELSKEQACADIKGKQKILLESIKYDSTRPALHFWGHPSTSSVTGVALVKLELNLIQANEGNYVHWMNSFLCLYAYLTHDSIMDYHDMD